MKLFRLVRIDKVLAKKRAEALNEIDSQTAATKLKHQNFKALKVPKVKHFWWQMC